MAKDKKEPKVEMTLEQSKAYRASMYRPTARVLSEQEKRTEFKMFWAREKARYGKNKSLEEVLWLHLKATKNDHPEKFEQGLNNFGLKKIK